MHGPSGTPAAILALLRDGPRQAHELADALGIDASAVRRHLEALRAEGRVDAEDVVAGPGRPKRKYRLTPKGEETFPRDYAMLLTDMMARLSADPAGRQRVLDALAGLARDLGGGLASEPDPRRRAERMLEAYNGMGFEASLEHHDGGFRLVQRNCILLRAARADPEALCDCLDEGIVRAAFPHARVRLAACMATGDRLCEHVVALGGGKAKAR